MNRRSRAREAALQLLFQHDLNPRAGRAVVEAFVAETLQDEDTTSFCLALHDGVLARLEEIDQRLSSVAENWRLPRMAAVDRNILRLGAYELLYMPETPPGVVLDEAIELARRFGSDGSPAFVNGVLDRVRQTVS